MRESRWSGPTVRGVDCNAPEAAVWTSVFAAGLAEVGRVATSEDIAFRGARDFADTAVIYLRRLEEERLSRGR